MKFLSRITSASILRGSLGVMYLYSGIQLFLHPTSWIWATPYWLRQMIEAVVTVENYIKFQGVIEIVFALILLAWFLPTIYVKWVAILSAIEFAAILVLAFLPWNAQNFLTTFRDIGLLGASLALAFSLTSKATINQ